MAPRTAHRPAVALPDAAADLSTLIAAARVAATATVRARFLAATPANFKNPQWFAERAQELAQAVSAGSPDRIRALVQGEPELTPTSRVVASMMPVADVRALRREPATRDALVAELRSVAGESGDLDAVSAWIDRALDDDEHLEARARLITERIALTLQAVQLLRSGAHDCADTFIASRLAGDHCQCLGTLPAGSPLSALIERAFPSI